jgi:hypothetical protein
MFPKIPLLKVNFKIFPTENLCRPITFYKFHFLSVENFPDQENFPQKDNFVKCDWPTQIFRVKKILKLKMFNL